MSKKMILVVEDEGVVAQDVQTRLEALGYGVSGWVASGQDALSHVDAAPPDLILMDIRLRGEMDGVETAERISAAHDIPVVFLTAFADEDTVGRAKVAHPYGYIAKPFSERDLQAAIEIALYKHQLDKTLRERELWLATTLASINDAVIATDGRGRITYLNPVAESLTEWTLDDARGRLFSEVFVIENADSGDAVETPMIRAVERRAPVTLKESAVLVSRSGAKIPIADETAPITAAPITNRATGLAGAVLVFRDITAKKDSETRLARVLDNLESANQNLTEQKRFLTALFESVPCSVAVLGEDNRIKMVNRHFKQTTGITEVVDLELRLGDLLGCPVAHDNPGTCGSNAGCDLCKVNGPLVDALSGYGTHRQRCNFESKSDGGTRQMTLLVSAAPLPHGGENLAIVILEDITELSGLRQLLSPERSFGGIVSASPRMTEIFNTIREVANINVPVMVLGESGTGKELVARAIHDNGSRSSKNFIPVNCGALPDGLLESELFGHVKGAFTGAVRDRKGRFELADGGTIFLDEVGDLSATMQVKLLRVLQEGTFERVGGEKTVSVDVRVICATNRDLEQEVKAGRFRDDLFYRLCVVPIKVPPLRDRIDDVPLIGEYIAHRESASKGGRRFTLSPAVMSQLMSHSWPGNVRELQNVLQYAFIKSKSGTIEPQHLPPTFRAAMGAPPADRKAGGGLTETAVAEAFRRTKGNRTRAAKVLGVSRATLYRFLSDHPGVG